VARTIHQEITIDADRARVFRALTDERQFAEVTGVDSVSLKPEAGAPFSLFGGHITGRNVELVADRRLVQAWRAASWPEGLYSIVNFGLEDAGGRDEARVRAHRIPRGGARRARAWVGQDVLGTAEALSRVTYLA
jgi:uncharacterized protein YndB with AHSA1/START domain